jgi:hypothetical protein
MDSDGYSKNYIYDDHGIQINSSYEIIKYDLTGFEVKNN